MRTSAQTVGARRWEQRRDAGTNGTTQTPAIREAQLAIDLERITEWERDELKKVDSDHAARGVFHSGMRIQGRDKLQREAERRRREARLRAGETPSTGDDA